MVISRMARKYKKSGKRRTHRGGGFSVDLGKMVSVGYPVNAPYTGAGKDCMGGSFERPGFMSGVSGAGVPGMRGGYQLGVASIEQHAPYSPPAPIVPPAAPQQKGGRYEVNPGPLLGGNSDIGMSSYASVGKIACEHGSSNSLNMHGGMAPVIAVGSHNPAINMTNAGYGHQFEIMKTPSVVGGLMINTPYDMTKFNPACHKTAGGKRKTRVKHSKGTRRHRRRHTTRRNKKH